MIHTFNYFVTRVCDVLLYPFEGLHEFWGILFLSIIMSLIVLVLYKYLSSARAVKDAKNQIKANILAIRIYKDFWQVIMLSFFKSFYYTVKYFALNFGPVIVIIPILFPLFSQMDARYGMRPFKLGEEIVVKSVYAENPSDLKVELKESPYFKPAMNPVFINAYMDEEKTQPIREVSWKLNATKKGEAVIQIQAGGAVYEKTVVIGRYRGALSNHKYSESNGSHFFNPIEPLFGGSKTVKVVSIHYPGRSVSVLGIRMHWIILNLILVFIIVLAFHKRFGVEF